MDEDPSPSPSLAIFGVVPEDPGYVYVVEDRGRYKIGRTKETAKRLKAAKTWLPDMQLIGCKPFWNVAEIERFLHAGFAPSWYAGEWFSFENDDERDLLLDGFLAFSDTDRDRNSIDFIYWFNGDGMAEFVMELEEQGLTLPKFLKQESGRKKIP